MVHPLTTSHRVTPAIDRGKLKDRNLGVKGGRTENSDENAKVNHGILRVARAQCEYGNEIEGTETYE